MRDVPWPPRSERRPRKTQSTPPPPAAHGPSRLERGFALFAAVLMGTQSVTMFLGGGTEGASARPLAVHLAFLSLYFVTFLLLLRTPRVFASFFAGAPLLALAVMWPFVSALWSIDRGASLQRGVALAGTSLVGLYLTWRYPLPQLVRILATAAVIAGAGSLLLILFVPSLGRMTTESWVGAWRGLYFHKNSLGLSTSLGSVMLVFALRDARGPAKLWAAAGLSLTLVLLVGSRSTTALLAFIAMTGVMAWSRNLQRRPATAWLFTLMVLALLTFAALPLMSASGFGAIMAFLGKNAEISGRLPLWDIVLRISEQRPWLGYGYEAFWNPDTPMVRWVAQTLRYMPFYSHSGVMETLLNGGRVLLVLVLLLYVSTLVRAYLFMRANPGEKTAALPLVFCFFFIFANFSESKVLLRNDIVWSLFVGFSFLTARSVRLSVRTPLAPFATAMSTAARQGGRI